MNSDPQSTYQATSENRSAKKSKNRAQLLQISHSINQFKKKECEAPRIEKYQTKLPSTSYIFNSEIQSELEQMVDRNKTLVLEQLEVAKKSITSKKTSSMVEKFIERAIDRYKTSGDSKKSRQKFNSVQSSKQLLSSQNSKNKPLIVLSQSIHSSRILLPPKSLQVMPKSAQSVKQSMIKKKLESSELNLNAITTTNEALQRLKQGTDSTGTTGMNFSSRLTNRKLSQRGISADKSARGDSRDRSARQINKNETQGSVTLDCAKQNYGSVKSKPLERINLKQKPSRQKNSEIQNGYNSIITSNSHLRASSQISAQENRSPTNRSKPEINNSTGNENHAHKARVQQAKSKMNHYCKEISFSTVKEFLKHTVPPSKLCFRSARCLCILLNAFYHYPHFKECTFSEWEQIRDFLQFRYAFIIQDIENIRGKCDGKQVQNDFLLEILKREVLNNSDCGEGGSNELISPKIQNLIYKPIFCYAFFVMSYLNLTKSSQAEKIQHSRSNSPYTKHAPTDSVSSRFSDKTGPSQKIVLSNLQVNKQTSAGKKREFGANIANQIFDTIKRVLEPSEFTRLSKKPQKQVLHSKSRAASHAYLDNSSQLRESEQSMKSMIDLKIDIPSPCIVQPYQNNYLLDSLDNRHPDISTSSSAVNLNQIYKIETPKSILSHQNPLNEAIDQTDFHQQMILEENTIDLELQSIDRRLAETLKQSIQNLQKKEKVKVEDLLSSINRGHYEPQSFFSNRKRSAIVQLSNQQISSLTPLDDYEYDQNYYTENLDIKIDDFNSKIDQQQILENAFEEFSKDGSLLIEDNEQIRSDMLHSQCSNLSHKNERDRFIQELKERREKTGIRVRGCALEEQTMKTIRDLSQEMQKDSGRGSSKLLVKIVKSRSNHTSSRATSRGDQSFTSMKKELRGIKLDNDRMKKTMNLIAICD